MLNLNNYIFEKLKINKNSKINQYKELSEKIKDTISDRICQYFQGSCSFRGIHYSNKLEIIDKFYNSDICSFFDDLDLWEDIHRYICHDIKNDSLEFNDFVNYTLDNKEQLYKDINDFVL